MKFVCDGCGKKYATAEDPSPGKVYKLKCKACGHLIVVKAVAGTSTAIPALTQSEAAGSSGQPTSPELEIEIEPESQAATTPPPGAATTPPPVPVATAAPLPAEVASAIDAAAPVPDGGASPADALPPPPPPEKDELADFAAAAAEVMAAPVPGQDAAAPGPGQAGYVDLFGDGATGEHRLKDDPFAAAARASLPAGFAGADPLAESRPAPKAEPAKAAVPKVAAAKPAAGMSPLVYVGLGVVLLVAITVVAIFTGGDKKAGPPPSPVAAAPAPTPPPPPKVEEPPPPPREEPKPAVVEKKPEPRPAVVERKPEPKPEPPRPRPPERKPEPKPEPKVAVAPPPPPPAPEPRTEIREVQLPDAESALTPEVVQKVINANRKAFAGCIAQAGSDVKMDGRKVALKLTVNANGAVTYPTLDDVTLNPTEMGQCLKSAARLMIFPKFKGDPFHVEVPLTLSN
ncbi:MAG: AgmX/PglI C-terminal domain-containing protein [Anaeromyxobacteraceae bacterium]|nr:AgmX/PglI C-terminal domain-containing protein [Anaeromyxobacteraceae bacterium]